MVGTANRITRRQTDMSSGLRRWDNDQRGHGIADGGWIAESVRALLAALEAPDWIAEDPDIHLLPHLQRACDVTGSPWALQSTEMVDGLYIVALDWSGPTRRLGNLRADVFALLGSIAETVLFAHQCVLDDAIHYDAATGIIDGDSPFRAHGHLIQLQIGGEAVTAICAGRRGA
jgi:hypothetical protein